MIKNILFRLPIDLFGLLYVQRCFKNFICVPNNTHGRLNAQKH